MLDKGAFVMQNGRGREPCEAADPPLSVFPRNRALVQTAACMGHPGSTDHKSKKNNKSTTE